MKTRQKLLTDEQWELIEPLLPKPKRRRDKRGRPPTPNWPCFECILWILKTGAAWTFSPKSFLRPRPSGEEVQLGGVMAHVVVRVGANLIENVFTRRSAEAMALKKAMRSKS